MGDSYYQLVDAADGLGERFAASVLCASTWSSTMQHAAPVSALLVRALERCAARDDTRISRVVVDLLGPVPVEGTSWVRAEVDRPGGKVERLRADMLAPGPNGESRLVAQASGWRLQTTATDDVKFAPQATLRPFGEGRTQPVSERWERNYLHSVDWRWLTEPLSDGPGESWLRPVVDLVAGEPMTPIQRLFAVADNANGLGSRLGVADWSFLNTDLAVHLHRSPEHGWIGIRSEASYGSDGIAATTGTLFDEFGPVGSIQQSVLVRRVGRK